MKIKSYKPNEINDCREASQISATILDELFSYISEGITTEEIDNYCLKRITKFMVSKEDHPHSIQKELTIFTMI